jgi:hypothetical protein
MMQNLEAVRASDGVSYVPITHYSTKAFLDAIRKDVANGLTKTAPLPKDRVESAKHSFQELIGYQSGTPFLSYEGFLGHSALDRQEGIYPHADHAAHYLRRFTEGMQVTVLLIVRRQDTFIESCYAQQIKEGRCLSFEEFYYPVSVNRLSWLKIADAFAQQFGQQSVKVMPFEAIYTEPEEFASNALSLLLGRPTSADIKPSSYRNPSISAKGIELARAVYPLLDNHIDRRKVQKFLFSQFSSATHGKANLLSDDDRSEILQAIASDNEKLFDAYMPSRPERKHYAAGTLMVHQSASEVTATPDP